MEEHGIREKKKGCEKSKVNLGPYLTCIVFRWVVKGLFSIQVGQAGGGSYKQ